MKIVEDQIVHDVADECASQQSSALIHCHRKNVSKWDINVIKAAEIGGNMSLILSKGI